MEIQAEFLQHNMTIEFLPYGSDMPYRIIVGNNPVGWVDPYGKALIGTAIGTGIGAVSGAMGAAAQGGDVTDILVGALTGAAVGAFMGFLDPTEGVATTMMIAGSTGFTANIMGQTATAMFHGKDWDIDLGSAIGSGIGSAIGGGIGNVMTKMTLSIGLSEGMTALMSGGMSMAPSYVGEPVGSALMNSNCK